jgi:hypothetical protein
MEVVEAPELDPLRPDARRRALEVQGRREARHGEIEGVGIGRQRAADRSGAGRGRSAAAAAEVSDDEDSHRSFRLASGP